MLLHIYVTYILANKNTEIKESWRLPTISDLDGIQEYLTLGIPSSFMRIIETLSLALLQFVAAMISVNSTAAHIILLNIDWICYEFANGY